MRIIITKTKAFKFNELAEKAQEKAIDGLWDINVEHDWWNFTYEDAENIGLRLTGFDLDRGAYCHGDFINSPEDCARKIIKEHGEKCETRIDAEAYLKEHMDIEQHTTIDDYGQFDDKTADKIDTLNREFHKSILEDYRIMLQQNYDYYTSREAIFETIEANDYEFTLEGKLI